MAEGVLFRTDYAAWCTYIAPRWVAMLQERGAVDRLWPIASETLRRAIWKIADDKTKDLIRRSRAGIATGTNDDQRTQAALF